MINKTLPVVIIFLALLFLGLLGFAAFTDAAVASKNWASPLGKDFLYNGALVRAIDTGLIYYIKDGKRSLVMKSVADKWFQEAHYFKSDVLIKLNATDLARYPETAAVNPLYIGKILQAPDGKQYFIDNLLRRRPISAAVRGALHYPSRNLYPTTVTHIAQFKLGPTITRTDVHPGGTVMYYGPYHGGTVWQIEEDALGTLSKRLYLQDYIYETQSYPWSSQILPVDQAELDRYKRGLNIDKYPNGWVVTLDGNMYLVQNGTLRLLPDVIRKAMGYNASYVLGVFPEFLRKYPRGEAILAFKTVTASVPASALTTSAPAPNVSSTYIKVRPEIRTLISQVNDIYLVIYDKQITVTENQFWVNYLYNGEVNTKAALEAAMSKAKVTGVKPPLTSRTAVLSPDILKSKWFPYLFYFVHQLEPSDADKAYWYGRIDSGDRNTIEKLGGTLQYIKDTTGGTRK